jgi:hypothetical protein
VRVLRALGAYLAGFAAWLFWSWVILAGVVGVLLWFLMCWAAGLSSRSCK